MKVALEENPISRLKAETMTPRWWLSALHTLDFLSTPKQGVP